MIDLLPVLVDATATARLQLKQWFARYPTGMPWIVVSDYCIGDVNKGNDVFSFVVVAPENICEYIAGAAPKDLKNTNKVPLGLVQYLTCEVPVTFSVSFVMRREAGLLRDYLSVEAMSALAAGAIALLEEVTRQHTCAMFCSSFVNEVFVENKFFHLPCDSLGDCQIDRFHTVGG